MIPNELLLLIVAGIAFYLGYKMGRMSVLAEGVRPAGEAASASPDVTTADMAPLPSPGAAPRPRSAPPPASAGGGSAGSATGAPGTPPRTAKPPPARAGLLDPNGGKK